MHLSCSQNPQKSHKITEDLIFGLHGQTDHVQECEPGFTAQHL